MGDRVGASRHADVVIVGGGVMGSAIACFLALDPGFDGRVVVVERDPTYRQASSALSASSIRQQFSTPENIRMSRFGWSFLTEAERHLSVDGGPVDVGLHEAGYLYLAGPDGAATLQANHLIQRSEGADVVLLDPDALRARFPWLAVDDLALGSLGLGGEGWFDGYALLQAFRRKARSLGVEYLPDEVVGLRVAGGRIGAAVLADEVAALRVEGSRVAAAVLADGTEIPCGSLVDAAGPWAARIAAMAGIRLPVEARRRCVFVFDARRRLPDCPLVIDPTGAWFRPEGDGFIAGTHPPEADDAADLPLEVDRRQFEDVLWPLLAARVPAFEAIRVTNAWAGYYEFDTHDHNAILGTHPEIANLYFANGFSGHGIQQSPAVGRAIAELIAHGRYMSLDLSVFGFERIVAGRRVVERAVIG